MCSETAILIIYDEKAGVSHNRFDLVILALLCASLSPVSLPKPYFSDLYQLNESRTSIKYFPFDEANFVSNSSLLLHQSQMTA